MTEAMIVYSTAPTQAVAVEIAEKLVEKKLAACVSFLPGLFSTYRWQGKVEKAEEVFLMIKTTVAHLEALTAALVSAHPYEVPEVLAVPVSGGLPAYLEWITDETAG